MAPAPKVTRAAPTRKRPSQQAPGSMRVVAFIGIGANLSGPWGNAASAVRRSFTELAQIPGCSDVRASSLHTTQPVQSSGPDYINAVASLHTDLNAPQLLAALQGIEAKAQRLRPYRNAPRTLDLDLLLFGGGQIFSPTLTVPHPRMWSRDFVLLPLAELTDMAALAQIWPQARA